jgi:hypothetical protein
MKRGILFLSITLGGLLACDQSPASLERTDDVVAVTSAARSFPMNAVVSFGRDDVGSKFPPPSGHDRSFHAKDNVRPQTVHISAGGSVTFQMGTFHSVAIYEPGIEPSDIDRSITVDLTAPPPAPPGTVIIPDFLLDDSTGRIAVGPFSFAPMIWTSPPGAFAAPGTYLIICRVVPHFVEAKMYAWVVVR